MRLKHIIKLGVVVLLSSGLVLVALSQTKNEVGLVIGATTTPSQSLIQGISPAGTTGNLSFNESLTLGAEYDRYFATSKRVAIYGGVDFCASPFDVKLSQPPPDVSLQYAYVFLTPHLRLKLRPTGPLAPWLSLGGGYARFLEQPPSSGSFRPGTNTGTFEIGAGIDTRTVVRVIKIPVGFRFEVRDFYSGFPNLQSENRCQPAKQRNVDGRPVAEVLGSSALDRLSLVESPNSVC